MFVKSQAYYDAVYSWKDYVGEAELVHRVIERENPLASTLLDVACGTGMHLLTLKRYYRCEGMDLDPGMVEIASERLGDVPIFEGDFTAGSISRKYDVVVCLFSSIGYAATYDRLKSAVHNMAEALNPDGVLLVEPWLTPEGFIDNHLGSLFVDRVDLKLARIHKSRKVGNQSLLEFHYLVGTEDGIERFEEEHVMGLYSDSEYEKAFMEVGLKPRYEKEGPMGRGLWVARK